jgi:hypothetical protein
MSCFISGILSKPEFQQYCAPVPSLSYELREGGMGSQPPANSFSDKS